MEQGSNPINGAEEGGRDEEEWGPGGGTVVARDDRRGRWGCKRKRAGGCGVDDH